MFGSEGIRARYLLLLIWGRSWENDSIVAGAGSRRCFSPSEAIIGREGLVWLVDMVLLLKSKWVMAVWCWWKVDADSRLPILMILVLYSSHCYCQYHWYWYRQYHWYQSWQCGWHQWCQRSDATYTAVVDTSGDGTASTVYQCDDSKGLGMNALQQRTG